MLNQALPYVYKLTHPATGEFYIGSRVRNKEAWDKDLPKYRTSSKYVKPRFDEFEMHLLMEFTQESCAYDYEQYMIFENLKNPLMLNRRCHWENKIRFSTAGKKASKETREKQRLAKLGKKHSPEHIEKCKKARVGIFVGRTIPDEAKEKIRQTLTGYKHTEEAKRNMSISHIGNTNGKYLKGVKKPDGHAQNVREANIGLRFWNNGEICVRTKECPDGFVPGMLPRDK